MKQNNEQTDLEFIESISDMIHSFLHRFYPTYNHNDLYNQCVIIALEKRKLYNPKKSKLSTWIYTQLKGHIGKYIKKNMITITVPHNIKPNWSFGNFDKMNISTEDVDYSFEEDVIKNRIEQEKIEDEILFNIKKELDLPEEHQIVFDDLLRGYTMAEIEEKYNKPKQWAKVRLALIERRLSKINTSKIRNDLQH